VVDRIERTGAGDVGREPAVAVVHQDPIAVRVDDSVARVVPGSGVVAADRVPVLAASEKQQCEHDSPPRVACTLSPRDATACDNEATWLPTWSSHGFRGSTRSIRRVKDSANSPT